MTIAQLPEFAEPPVAEVALSGQFVRLASMRAMHLGRFYGVVRDSYPAIDEQMPLPPVTEATSTFGTQGATFMFGAPPMQRHWFISPASDRLIQVQQDRIVLNWRRQGGAPYPHYGDLRAELARLLPLFGDFVAAEELGELQFTQGELTYTNVIEARIVEELGGLTHLTSLVEAPPGHHLGSPEAFRGTVVFEITDDRLPSPARLYVDVGSALGPPPAASVITLTVRGAPLGPSATDLLAFLDAAHEHLITSFAELTGPKAHTKWGRAK